MRAFTNMKVGVITVLASAALLAACGSADEPAADENAVTTEMLSTETTLDGTTNDTTTLDAAAGINEEVSAAGNEIDASGNAVAE